MSAIRYLSLCSGIEAATMAWHRLGWQPVAFAEIEPFPAAVLAHHYPDVPNLGDMTRWREWPEEMLASVDVLVGGTPCQAFSVAGLRNSLADERGNLTLIYAHIIEAIDQARARHGRPPAVCLWENVPGVLNTDDNALGCFLAALAGEDVPLLPPGGRWTDAGYVRGPRRAIAWRCLDAQYFGLAQRRERVFLVAGAGDGFRPEAVLFEQDGVRRDSPPSRKAGQGASYDVAPCIAASGRGFEQTGDTRGQDCVIPEIAGCLQEHDSKGCDSDTKPGHLIPVAAPTNDVIGCLNSSGGHAVPGNSVQDAISHQLIPMTTHTLRGEGFDASEDGNGRGTPLIAVNSGQGFYKSQHHAGTLDSSPRGSHENNLICVHGTQDPCTDDQTAFALGRNSGQENAIAFEPRCARNGRGMPDVVVPPLKAESGTTGKGDGAPCVAFTQNTRDEVREMPYAGALPAEPGAKQQTYIRQTMQVRRLTPTECERLQGFPDGFTAIPWRKKPASDCPDGPRYKALGNSMAEPCMHWIGRRLDAFLRTPQTTTTPT